jgi:hypothetical protein
MIYLNIDKVLKIDYENMTKYFKLKKYSSIFYYIIALKEKPSYLKCFIRHPKSGPPRFTSIMQKGGQIFHYIIFSCCHSTTHNTFSHLH